MEGPGGWLEKVFETNASIPVFGIVVAVMHHEQHQRNEWARAKALRASHGFTFPQLLRLAQDGLIRTSHVRRPGQTRGVRLFNVGDLDSLISENVEPPRAGPLVAGKDGESLTSGPLIQSGTPSREDGKEVPNQGT